ncbi:hypothetical protein INT43_008943 [Umbelopsis isabellina]|uniref:Protein PNS1 n=1 Tax=Mortierella isabellina TaxID=91625 RepID=A0A8H7PWU9_MORIS|nr:hypothetical protein INT43_008943 [Umbelopsis isabellina]
MSNQYYPPPPTQQEYDANKGSQQQPYGSGPPSYNYNNNQNYDPEAASYGNYGQPPPPQQQQQMNMSGEGKVEPSSGFKDVWATILWLLNMGAFIGLSVIGLRAYNSNHTSYGGVPSQSPSSGITFDTSTFIILGLAVVIGFGCSVLYFLFANKFPRLLIKVTFILSILFYFGVTFYYFAVHYYSAAIVFLIFSVIYAFMWFAWKSRIPFATIMLETVTSITSRYPSTIVVGIITLLVQTAYSIWFSLVVIGVYEAYYSSSGSNGALTGIMVFLVFSFYWTSQVISYVCHVTISGIFASVYFLGDSVRSPVLGSARRALTTSFGSICFGGLLMAFMNMIRVMISISRAETNNALCSILLCFVQCIVNCIQGLLEWFNYYAFSGVAIYGRGFVESAKRTWTLIKDRGVEALINDNLINNVLFMGGLLVGVITSLFGFIYLAVAQPAFNSGGQVTPVIVMMCFIIGLSMFSSIATVISSGVATTFVCLAEDPDALRRTKPELWERIRQTWPRVVQSI